MRCAEFEERLEGLLEGSLEPSSRRRCHSHAESCRACRDLLVLAGGAQVNQPEEAPASLLDAVLAATSGGGCAQAREALGGLVDERLHGSDRDLVEMHLDGCGGCAESVAVLRCLSRDLPLLAEWRVDPGFVDEVLAASLPVEVRLRRWFQRTWPKWVRRPRFALEAAYIGTLALMLIFYSSGSPLEAMPRRALSLVQNDPLSRLEAPISSLEARVEQRAGSIWAATGEPLVASGHGLASTLTARAEELLTAIRSGYGTASEMIASLLEKDGGAGSQSDSETDEEMDR